MNEFESKILEKQVGKGNVISTFQHFHTIYIYYMYGTHI